MIESYEKKTRIRLFVPDRNRLEGDALQQLAKTADYPGMAMAAALPDLHPGKGGPVGAAFLTRDFFYPYLIGSDIGCGVALYKTGLRKGKIKRDKWAKKLSGFEAPWDGNTETWLSGYRLSSSGFDSALGTIGGGNHFAELQVVEKVVDEAGFQKLGLDRNLVTLAVHSGSRGLGASLLRRHVNAFGADGLAEHSDAAAEYLDGHDTAVRWAEANRDLIALRFLTALGTDGRRVLDLVHNRISEIKENDGTSWLHRKGVTASDAGPLLIPGTRGSLTYLVKPSEDQTANLWSVAHGAGRKWNRKSVKKRLKDKFHHKSLIQTDLGGLVICEDRDLLYEEAPQAYKNIDRVIQDMAGEGLVTVIATFRPVITYKTRERK